jgi:hypothetical protein
MSTHHNDITPCQPSLTAMAILLAIFGELSGHCSRRWVLASPLSSLEPQGYFVGTRTCGTCVWLSTRRLWLIVFMTSAKWSRPPHRVGHLREVCWMLHEKLWPFYDMKWMIKWSIRSTATSRAKPEKELKSWCCPREIVTALDALPTKWSCFMA